jgi:predicted nucleic acid-binding protein
LIGLDTNVLIYASKQPDEPDPRGFNQSARELVSQLTNDKTQRDKRVLVPSLCLAEYLTGIPKSKRNAVLKNLESWTFIAGFDASAAGITADLMHDVFLDWKDEKASNPESDYAKRSRQIIKSDVIVLATAIAHGGTILYTTEEVIFSRMAGGRIDVKSLPALQPTLFASLELKPN